MNKRIKILFLATTILLLAFIGLLPEKSPAKLTEPLVVTKVIDGDTIAIGDMTVRMIGIDTPESVNPDNNKNTEYGKIASEYTDKLLTGKAVQLEYDTEYSDTYGRTLAYVYLDGEMVNEMLLQKGLARTMTIPPNTKYADRFARLEQEVKINNIGFWNNYYKENTNER